MHSCRQCFVSIAKTFTVTEAMYLCSIVSVFERGITLLGCSEENASSGHGVLTAAMHTVGV